MPDTVSDTGPILHLEEIGELATLSGVAPLVLSDLVVTELEIRGVGPVQLQRAGVEFTVASVAASEWREALKQLTAQIQPADAQVFVLVRASDFKALALTDDLILRRLLESHGARVAGTVGVLIRAYASGRISRADLDTAIESLFKQSSLFISRAFRSYLKKLLIDLE